MMGRKKTERFFDISTADGQKRLMAVSMGLDSETYIGKPIDLSRIGDYGSDPIGEGKFRMVPSGDIVDLEERNQRLNRVKRNPTLDVAPMRGPIRLSSGHGDLLAVPYKQSGGAVIYKLYYNSRLVGTGTSDQLRETVKQYQVGSPAKFRMNPGDPDIDEYIHGLEKEIQAGFKDGNMSASEQLRRAKSELARAKELRRGKAKENPPSTMIYSDVLSIRASKAGMKHHCDAACKRAGHKYEHKFKPGTAIFGSSDHTKITLRGRK